MQNAIAANVLKNLDIDLRKIRLEVEKIVRENGATPATIAIIDGEICVGLDSDQLNRIANDDSVIKASTRDLAILTATKKCAATTVAATAHIAAMAKIPVFATGGLGGVHRGDGFEVFHFFRSTINKLSARFTLPKIISAA